MSGDRLPCGHQVGWLLRLKDGHKIYKYCWGCILDKIGIEEVYAKKTEEVKDSKPTVKKTDNKK